MNIFMKTIGFTNSKKMLFQFLWIIFGVEAHDLFECTQRTLGGLDMPQNVWKETFKVAIIKKKMNQMLQINYNNLVFINFLNCGLYSIYFLGVEFSYFGKKLWKCE